jgi:hypothetical protein
VNRPYLILDPLRRRFQAQPEYGPKLCVLAMIDAALGRKDLALDEGRRAIVSTLSGMIANTRSSAAIVSA